jgi:hypothetical protein
VKRAGRPTAESGAMVARRKRTRRSVFADERTSETGFKPVSREPLAICCGYPATGMANSKLERSSVARGHGRSLFVNRCPSTSKQL